MRRKRPFVPRGLFDAQQCAEKYLKALLLVRDQAFPKTHDLLLLSELCAQAQVIVPISADLLDALSMYAVQVRYPGQRLRQTTPAKLWRSREACAVLPGNSWGCDNRTMRQLAPQAVGRACSPTHCPAASGTYTCPRCHPRCYSNTRIAGRTHSCIRLHPAAGAGVKSFVDGPPLTCRTRRPPVEQDPPDFPELRARERERGQRPLPEARRGRPQALDGSRGHPTRTPWKAEIQKAIQKSDFFLVCLSTCSARKRGVIQDEIKEALETWRKKLEDDIYLIPVRLEGCEVPDCWPSSSGSISSRTTAGPGCWRPSAWAPNGWIPAARGLRPRRGSPRPRPVLAGPAAVLQPRRTPGGLPVATPGNLAGLLARPQLRRGCGGKGRDGALPGPGRGVHHGHRRGGGPALAQGIWRRIEMVHGRCAGPPGSTLTPSTSAGIP